MLRSFSNQEPQDNATLDIRALKAARNDDDSGAPATLAHEVELLRAEKAALRHTLDELENLLEQKMQTAQSTYVEQQKQEALLEEKSEEIRELHLRLLEGPATGAAREPGLSPREDELLALGQELEHERRQLRSDEKSLTDQMREMEVQMSRERAELARQRHELQRLHGEVVHEVDRASRNSALRERLQPLQRRLHREEVPLPREALVAAPTATIVPATVSPAAQPTAIVPAQALAPPVPPTAVPRALAPPVPPTAVPLALAPPEAVPPTKTPPAVAPPVAAAESQPPAPSRQPPADDHDDLLRRLFG